MPETRSLRELLHTWHQAVAGTTLPQPPAYDGPDVALTGLVEHTGAVRPGACFVARVRTGSDGHPYIPQALAGGASLILGQHPAGALGFSLPPTVPYLQVADTALASAWLAAAWEGFPGRELVMIGVTGTDGKTTTANLLHAVLHAAGYKVGLVSTLRAIIGGQAEPLALHVTTPEAPVVQRYLRRMVEAGLTHCILETTSHSLAQHRVAAIDFDVAVVTNITHEHLDYHGDYAGYLAAKMRLFQALNAGEWPQPSPNADKRQVVKTAVLNRDDGSYEALAKLPAARRLTYSLRQPADVWADGLAFAADATRFALHLGTDQAAPVVSPLVGDFNVYNMLAAAGAALALGVDVATVAAGLAQVQSLTGRMQRIDAGQPFMVVVDFAHTPNALAKAIEAARRMTPGRVITVFGSAGKRDVAKRYLMAEAAAQAADLTILTAEDPRTESLDEILAMMAEGCVRQGGVEGESFWRVPDRGRAIYQACKLARPGDLVLVCGKGHEQSMCFGTIEYPWDDVQATTAALQALLAGQPMPDLGLPTFRHAS